MIKKYFYIISFLTLLFACSRHNKNIQIDQTIKSKVENNIKKVYWESGRENECYDNKLFVELYQNDTLLSNTYGLNKYANFRSHYYWSEDTLIIGGYYFPLYDNLSFKIKLYDDSAHVYNICSSYLSNRYKLKKTDNPTSLIYIPCSFAKVILSEIPDSNEKQNIYGFVSIQANDYYELNGNGVENKMRVKMDVYFKSNYFNDKERYNSW